MGYNLLSGFQIYFIGLRTIKQYPGLKKWMLIPFLIDLVLFLVSIYLIFDYLPVFVTWMTSFFQVASMQWLFDIFYYLLLFLFGVIGIVASLYLVYALGIVIAAPFNSLLAEKTLQLSGALPEKPFDLSSWLSFTVKMLMISIVKATLFLVVGLAAFVLSFIPGLNILSIYITLYMMSLDLFDYSLEATGNNLSQRLKFGREEVSMISGVSMALFVTTLIPGLFFLLAPLGVVGASRIHAQKILEARSLV